MRSAQSSNQHHGRAKLLGLLRALLLMMVVLGATLTVSYRQAKAHLGESLLAFGDELSAWTSGKLDSKVGHVSVNGVLVHRVTASTNLPLAEVLDRLQDVCASRSGVANTQSLLKAPVRARAKQSLLGGIYRHEGKSEGVLACIDSQRPLGVVELSRRLERFASSGDLSAIGNLRYVLARTDGDSTSLLVLWTDGAAPLLKMFPKVGDAAGRDVPDVPRPEDSTRLLSAFDLSAPYSIAVYRSRGTSPPVIQTSYEKRLTGQGWRVFKSKDNSLVAQRGTRKIVIHTMTVTSGSTTTSILELS